MPWVNELMNSTLYGLHDHVLHLLQSGHSPDGPGDLYLTPLHVAILNNDLRMTTLLLDHCADVELRNHDENTPVYSCLKNNVSIELLDLLLACNAKLDITNMLDRTPLHVATQFSKSQDKINRIITRSQTNTVNRVDYYGNTAFHYLLRNTKLTKIQLVELIKIFIHEGATIKIPDRDFRTPFHLALKHSFCLSIVQRLLVSASTLLPWSIKWKYGQNILHFLFYNCKDAGQVFSLLTERSEIRSVLKRMLAEIDDTESSAISVYLRRTDCEPDIVQRILRLASGIEHNVASTALDTLMFMTDKPDTRHTTSGIKLEIIQDYLNPKNVEDDKVYISKKTQLMKSRSIVTHNSGICSSSVQYTLSKLMDKLAEAIRQLDNRFEITVKRLNNITQTEENTSTKNTSTFEFAENISAFEFAENRSASEFAEKISAFEFAENIPTFEFAFCLNKFAGICEFSHCDSMTSLLLLRSRDYPPQQEYANFFDANRRLLPSLIKDIFSSLLRVALGEIKNWSFPRISFVSQTINTWEQDDDSFQIAWNLSNDYYLLFKVRVIPVIEDGRILPWTLHANSVPLIQNSREFIKNDGVMFRIPKLGKRYFSTLYSKYGLFDEKVFK